MAETLEDSEAPLTRDGEVLEHVSAYPVPPLDYFARFFADEVGGGPNLEESSAAIEIDDDDQKSTKNSPFPAPPQVPADLTMEAFGCLITPTDHTLRELEDQGIDRLGSEQNSRRRLLKALMWSTISKFFEVLDCLILDPQSDRRVELTTDLQTIFINLHHTVNQYRVPQGYDSLTELLKFQTLCNIKQSETLLASMTTALDLINQPIKAEPTSDNGEFVESDGLLDDAMGDDLNGVADSVDVADFRTEVADLKAMVAAVRQRSETAETFTRSPGP